MKKITIELQDHEYNLLKEVQSSEFTDLASETDVIRWSIALAKLCLEEIQKLADHNKNIKTVSPTGYRDPFAGSGIKPEPAPSTLVDQPLDRLIWELLARDRSGEAGAAPGLGAASIDNK
jgi:hypothetical protein